MTDERTWEQDWDALVAERQAARMRWLRSTDDLAERARDPLGIKSAFRDHPVISGAIAAGVTALLATFFVRKRKKANAEAGEPASGDGWLGALRDTALKAVVPFVSRFVGGKLAEHFGSADGHARASEGAPSSRI